MTSITWKNAISDNFSVAGDWNGGVVPGASDDAVLGALTSAAYTVTAQGQTVNDLQTAANATLAVAANSSFTMNAGTGAGVNAGQITVANNSSLTVGGTVNNTSTVAGGGIALNGTVNATYLRLASSATTTFTGAGSVVLGGTNNIVTGNSGSTSILDNVNNTFSGVGTLGNGSMTITNESAGVVNANVSGGTLTLNPNGGVTNKGLLEATGGGHLFLVNTGIDNTKSGNAGKITATGSGSSVDLQNTSITGGTLTAGAGAQFDIVTGQQAWLYGTTAGAPVNIAAGTAFNVNNNSTLNVQGTISNAGTVTLGGTANTTYLRLLGNGNTTFNGGGKVVLGGSGNNAVLANNGSTGILDNVNETFSGAGDIGDGSMTMINETNGLVNADQTGILYLRPNGGVYNTGTLEASNTGGLFIYNTGVDNTGNSNAGKISAIASGAHVDLQNFTDTGGTFSSVAGAQIDVVSGQSATLDGSTPGSPVNIAAGTTFNVNNNSNLYVLGTINNAGTINLLGTPNATFIRLNSPLTTLTGGGKVVFGPSGNNYIYGSSGQNDELDNVNNTISGVGNVGNGSGYLVNETAGVINADQAGQLVIQMSNGVLNTGLLEATNTGGLFIYNTTIDNTRNTNAGKISAIGTNAHVDLQSSTFAGGTLTTSGTGAAIDVVTGQAGALDGSTAMVNITAGSTVKINNNSTLYLYGVINNAGTIDDGLDGDPNATYLRVNSPIVTLQGGGVVLLGNSDNNYIASYNNNTQTLNNVDNKIQGDGNIGAGTMTLINGKLGVINANQQPGTNSTGRLTLQVANGVTNNGTLEATVGAGHTTGGDLFIVNTYVDSSGGGKILATGSSTVQATVDLQNSTLHGGSLTAKGKGVIEVVAGQSATLDGAPKAVTIVGPFNILNSSNLYVDGTVSNKGTISLLGAANATYIRVNSNVFTLSGTGKLILGGVNNYIIAQTGAQQFVNNGNTISGAGNIGGGTNLQLVNKVGTINANQTTQLVIQENQAVLNTALIESTNSGGLFLENTTINNTLANSLLVPNSGQLTATGTGHIDIQSTSIQGGTLTSTGSAYFDVVAGQIAYLDGTVSGQQVNIAAGTNFNINNNAQLLVYGTIHNAGTITLNSTGNATYLRPNSSVVTFTGGGNIVLAGSTANDYIYQYNAQDEIDNVDNTISGGGNIGGGTPIKLINEAAGTINATVAGGFAINLGGVEMINAGLLEATGGPVSVTNAIYNTGNITANGGNVTIGGNVDGTGNMTLSGGSNLEIGSSYGPNAHQTITFSAGATGALKIDQAQWFNGTISGFIGNATAPGIDLANFNFATASFVYSGTATTGTLTVTDNTYTVALNLINGSGYSQASFVLQNDGAGHVLIKDPPVGGSPQALASAMAGFGSSSGSGSGSSGLSSNTQNQPLITAPH
jgi:hypothetical protein